MTLRGDHSLGKTLVSLKTMLKTLRHEGKGILVELNEVRWIRVLIRIFLLYLRKSYANSKLSFIHQWDYL